MKLSTFKKGVHPREYKQFAENKNIEKMGLPKEVFVPLIQHIGTPCTPIVKKRDVVKAGQLIGEGKGFISSKIHAPISGVVKTIDNFAHPNGSSGQMIHIVGNGEADWNADPAENVDWEKLSKEELIKKVNDAGIVGMGGAAFPSHVKLQPPKDKKIDVFIINGCECEPYLTADHRMMVEQAEEIILGVRIIMKALDVTKALIGIENNKPDAIEIMTKVSQSYNGITILPLKVKYPQGAEKMLIKAAVNREVPTGALPMDVGAVVNNVGTAIGVAEAVVKNKPLIERVVTVTGDGVKEPKNVLARIGTPFRELIEFCGGLKEDAAKILMGGPMMGVTQYTMDVPVIKATSGILCLSRKSAPVLEEYACLQCGTCVNACPMNLLPTRISRAVDYSKFEMAEQLGAMNCIECGCCVFACPSNIPIVQKIRIGKLKINELKKS